MKNISVRITEELDSSIMAISQKSGKSKSEVIREAIKMLCNARSGKNSFSCKDLCSDLSGVVQGPKDLSHNKKHMKGYGK